MHTFFDAANIALKQFTYYGGNSVVSSHVANDGDFDTCFTTTEKEPSWTLELGANVRVSMVFILHKSDNNLEGFDILVGECVLLKAFCIFCLLLYGSLLIVEQHHVFRIQCLTVSSCEFL